MKTALQALNKACVKSLVDQDKYICVRQSRKQLRQGILRIMIDPFRFMLAALLDLKVVSHRFKGPCIEVADQPFLLAKALPPDIARSMHSTQILCGNAGNGYDWFTGPSKVRCAAL